MPLIGGSTGGVPTSVGSGVNPRISGAVNTAIGKVSLGVTDLSGSAIQSASNIAGVGVAGVKAAVQGAEGIPLVGPLAIQPATRMIGGIADKTIGQILPKKIDTAAVADFANKPVDMLSEVLTGPSQTISEAVLRARIQDTVENKASIFSFIPGMGSVPQSVVDMYKRGSSIDDIATSLVNKFGPGTNEEYGAFSQNGIANFLFTIFTDPLNIVPVGKPFSLASRASKIVRAASDAGITGAEFLARQQGILERDLASLVRSGADESAIAAQKQLIAKSAEEIKFFSKWETAGQLWGNTFGRISDSWSAFRSGPVAKNFVQSWSRVNATKGASWITDKIAENIGRSAVVDGFADVSLTAGNAAASSMVQVATGVMRNRFDEAAQNIVRKIHAIIASGGSLETALAEKWSTEQTIGEYLSKAGIPQREFNDLAKIFASDVPADAKTFLSRPEVQDVYRRIGSTISNSKIARDPEFILRTAAAQGQADLSFATDAAVDVMTKDKSTIIRFAQDRTIGESYLARLLQFGWEMTPEKASQIAKSAFDELGVGSQELIDAIDMQRMKSFGRLIRLTSAARAGIPKSFAELPSTVARRQTIAKTFFAGLAEDQAMDAAAVLDSIARASASNAGKTIEQWYAERTLGLAGISEIDDAVTIVDSLKSSVGRAKNSFATASNDQLFDVANSIKPTQRMLDAGLADTVSPIEVIIPENGTRGFALPGGKASLYDGKPFSLLDEMVIAAQSDEAFKNLDPEIRVALHAKQTLSKNIDMTNPLSVANRMAFSLFSPRRNLANNAELYQMMRITKPEDVVSFVSKWGDEVRNAVTEADRKRISYAMSNEFGFPGAELGIVTQFYDVARIIVGVADNPDFFKIAAGETPIDFAERMTLLNGVGLKVGIFGVELMNTGAMAAGAIDSQMSYGIWKWAKDSGLINDLVADIRSLGTTEANYYADKMLEQSLKFSDGGKGAGIPAKGRVVALTKKAIASGEISQSIVEWFQRLPAYAKPQTPTVTLFKGSSMEVMNKWLDRMASDYAKNLGYTGLDKLSGAQKQWFIWDIIRQQFEPHYWLSSVADNIAKPSAEDVRAAYNAIRKAGGTTKAQGFKGIDPNDIVAFAQKRGDDVLGLTSIDSKGRSMIELFQGADVSTAIHEIGHFARRQLSPEDNAIILDVYNITDGIWSVAAEERFADDFTKYLHSGQSPVRELDDVFYRMRQWLSSVWNSLKGTSVDPKIDPRLKSVFDRMFIANGESLAAPTSDFYSRITLVSERSLTQAARREVLDRVDFLLGKSDGGKVTDIDTALSRIPENATEYKLVEDGGATYNPIRGTAKVAGKDRGFSVGIDPRLTVKFTGADRLRLLNDQKFLEEQVATFVRKNERRLSQDGIYVGLYDNPKLGISYIDLSRVYNTAEAALEVGQQLGEESIFSFKNYDTIYLNTEKGATAAAAAGKSVTKSANEIANLADLEIRDVPTGSTLEELQAIGKNVVDKFDDPAAEFFGKPHSWEDVVQWLRDHPEVTVRKLNDIERANLPEQFKQILPQMEATGLYDFGVAPENGVIRRMAWATDRNGNRYLTRQAMPFVDTLDHVAVSKIDEMGANVRRIPNKFDRVADKFRKYGPEVVRNNFIQRFVREMTKKGISVREAERIVSEVSNLAYRKETKVQGLWFEQSEIKDIYREVLGRTRYEDYVAANDPVKDIMSAAAGDLSVIGLTSGFTGRAKAWRPVIGAMTDRLYPLFRFGKGNPVFSRILEPIETRIAKLVDGIKNEYRRDWLAETDSTIVRKMTTDYSTANMEIADGLIYNREAATSATVAAAEEAKGFVSNVTRAVKDLYTGAKQNVLEPWQYKEISRNATASQIATRMWVDAMNKYAPGYLAKMSEHYGVSNADELVQRLLEDWMIASNPAALEARIGREAMDMSGLYERTLLEAGVNPSQAREVAAVAYGIWSDSIRKATRYADKMQYFASHRSWFERSINHPFLALYPYSYMTQKAIPMMLKLMFAPRIGKYIHPFAGYINYERFKEMVVASAEGNDDFISQIITSPELGYSLSILIPAMPENMGFSAPNWVRTQVLRPAMQGKGAQLSKVPETIAKTVMAGTVAGQGASFAEAFASINKPLSQDIKDFRESVAESLQRNLSNK